MNDNRRKTKVGIMTFWSSDENYGQLLQAFALSTTIDKLGMNAFLVKYDGIADKTLQKTIIERVIKGIFHPSMLLKFLVGRISKSNTVYANERRQFDKFREEHLKFSRMVLTYDELKANPPEADYYICGSDMIWCAQSRMKPYFLQFVPTSAAKIAYAPSFGRKNIDQAYRKEIYKAVKDFDFLSVREGSAVNMFEKIGIRNCRHMPDPTLLLEGDEYLSRLAVDKNKERNNQLFAYILGDESNFLSVNQEKFCHEHNIDYVYTSAHKRRDRYRMTYLTIEQWIEKIANSKYFVTNSFHGCIFAILFRTPFVFYPLTGVKAESNERIYSLLKKVDLEDRIFKGNMDILFEKIDFDAVHSVIKDWQEEGIAFLKEAMLSSIKIQ